MQEQHQYGSCLANSSENKTNNFKLKKAIPVVVAVILTYFCALQTLTSNASTQIQRSSMRLHHDTKQKSRGEKLPYKFSTSFNTPRTYQGQRGTCWDFASIAVLEQSYRKNGVHKGYLNSAEYVKFSEQAYGKEILRACSGPKGSQQQINCRTPGNQIWKNSTEGGESSELYFLGKLLERSAFPDSTCPYISKLGHDTACDGANAYTRKRNPISFNILGVQTYYEEYAIKRALFNKKESMAFTTEMPTITHYYPCVGAYLLDDRCNPKLCDLCPPQLAAYQCCLPVKGGENYNMKGEFISHSNMAPEGGHVMTLVGYNDAYQTLQGYVGGFILKNSWYDGTKPLLGPRIARGSHSIQYWMEEISAWDERKICPNSHSPYEWYQCSAVGEVVHKTSKSGGPPSNSTDLDICLTESTAMDAKLSMQPLNLICTDASRCDVRASTNYFLRNLSSWGDEMTKSCFLEYNFQSKTKRDICFPPMLVQQLAYVFQPLEIVPNHPDYCGYYFFPYKVLRDYKSKYDGFYVNAYDIMWSKTSYLKHADYDLYNYTNLQASTRNQLEVRFTGPFPNAVRVGINN